MMKNIKYILLLVVLVIPVNAFSKELETYSNNVLVYNLNDNEILYEKNSNEKVSIASLTKIMTVIVALENIDNYDKKIIFPKIGSLYGYTKAGFKYKEELTYNDLLYSAILPSAADATEGLGVLISGNTSDFVSLMNEKAKELNMNNTSFSNTYGKDNDLNYSTLDDLLKLMLYALNNKHFYKIFTTKTYTLTNGKTIKNSVLSYTKTEDLDTSSIIGAKTGYTFNAGYCMISIYNEGDINLLIITTNADYTTGKPLQVMDGINIGTYYKENYRYFTILNKDEYLTTLSILGFKKDIYSDEEIKLFLNKNTEISKKYRETSKINLKSKAGDKIGEYIIKYDDNEIVKDVVIPNNFLVKFYLFMSMYLYIVYWFTRFIIFI